MLRKEGLHVSTKMKATYAENSGVNHKRPSHYNSGTHKNKWLLLQCSKWQCYRVFMQFPATHRISWKNLTSQTDLCCSYIIAGLWRKQYFMSLYDINKLLLSIPSYCFFLFKTRRNRTAWNSLRASSRRYKRQLCDSCVMEQLVHHGAISALLIALVPTQQYLCA